jgi:hypothetical protein
MKEFKLGMENKGKKASDDLEEENVSVFGPPYPQRGGAVPHCHQRHVSSRS